MKSTRRANHKSKNEGTPKQQLARGRNYFKFVLVGMSKPIDLSCLTSDERQSWARIMAIRKELLLKFDANSKTCGLNVKTNKERFFDEE